MVTARELQPLLAGQDVTVTHDEMGPRQTIKKVVKANQKAAEKIVKEVYDISARSNVRLEQAQMEIDDLILRSSQLEYDCTAFKNAKEDAEKKYKSTLALKECAILRCVKEERARDEARDELLKAKKEIDKLKSENRRLRSKIEVKREDYEISRKHNRELRKEVTSLKDQLKQHPGAHVDDAARAVVSGPSISLERMTVMPTGVGDSKVFYYKARPDFIPVASQSNVELVKINYDDKDMASHIRRRMKEATSTWTTDVLFHNKTRNWESEDDDPV